MAFTNLVVGGPDHQGDELTSTPVAGKDLPDGVEKRTAPAAVANIGDLGLLLSPVYNPGGALEDGWQTVGTDDNGGDDGSTRPASGMIYPRGTC